MHEPEFFVIGLPRSGTTWLAQTLSRMNPEILINHEACKRDFAIDVDACFSPWKGEAYMAERRQWIADRQESRPRFTRYGEVTPRARYFSGALCGEFLKTIFVHLVRDPRKAVVSMMNYGYYDTVGRPHRREAPHDGVWSKVKRASWAWAYGHHRIRQSMDRTIRFEDLVADYDAFEYLTRLVGLMRNREQWEKCRAIPANASQHATTRSFEKWTPSEKAEFWDMVGPEAEQYGYTPGA